MVTVKHKNADKHAELTALFRAGLGGDTVAYQRFLQQVAHLLRRMVRRKLPMQDAEDVLQEILISIHKARATYDGERPLMPWLRAIASFRINDALRKAYAGSRRESVNIDDFAETLPDVTQTPSEDESVDEMLKDVAPREQRILTLMHVEGYTAKEAGERLGMNESAVKVAAHRAIKKLREKTNT